MKNFLPALLLPFLLSFVSVSDAQPVPYAGSIDRAFGRMGIARTPPVIPFGGQSSAVYDDANDAVVRPDGWILVAGSRSYAGTGFLINLYDPSGTLDRSFGNNGSVYTSFPGYASISSIALQPDGKIVAAGWVNNKWVLVRYEANGAIDQSFGSSGIVVDDFAGFEETGAADARKAFVLPDGRITVTGTDQVRPYGAPTELNQGRVVMARYNADGSRDLSFGELGRTIIPLPLREYTLRTAARSDDGSTYLTAAAHQAVKLGISYDEHVQDFVLIKLTAGGQLDGAFGQNGILRDTSYQGYFDIVGVLPGDKLLITNRTSLQQLNADGSLAEVILPDNYVLVNGERFRINNYIRQDNGKLLVDGSFAIPSTATRKAIVQLLPNGQADTSFGRGGATAILPADFDLNGHMIRMQPEGKILSITTALNNPFRFVMARFNGDMETLSTANSKR